MADRYWVGGNANWDATAGTKWATTSGGAGGAAVPLAGDDVYLDNGTGTGNVTVAANVVCRKLDCTGYTGTLTTDTAGRTITIGTSSAGAGNIALKFVTGMTYTSIGANLTFNSSVASTTMTIDFAGKTTDNVSLTANATSGYQLVNGGGVGTVLSQRVSTNTFTLSQGALDTNNLSLALGRFLSTSTSTRVLTLGSSSISLASSVSTDALSLGATGLTLNSNTATFSFIGNGGTICNTGGVTNLNGASIVSTGSSVLTITSTSGFTCANITRTGTADTVRQDGLRFGCDITVSGTFTATGNSVANRLLIDTTVVGTQRTITAAVVSITNSDFRDIVGAGAGSWTGTSLGDCEGNSGITFTTPVTRYWVANANGAAWSSTSSWSTTSGGASGASVPLAQDTVIWDNSSQSANRTGVLPDMRHLGRVDMSAMTSWTVTFSRPGPGFECIYYGNIDISRVTTVGTNNWASIVMAGRGNHTIKWPATSYSQVARVYCFGGSYTSASNMLGDATSTFQLTSGTYNGNGFAQNVGIVTSGSGTDARTLILGTGLWSCINTGPGTVWLFTTTTGVTLDVTGSTISFGANSASAKTFSGGGLTYNDVIIPPGGTGLITIAGSNTFNSIKMASAGSKTIAFTAGTSQTLTGGAAAFINGTSGNVPILQSTAGGSAWTIVSSTSISSDYISLQDSTASGTTPFYAGANSTNVSGNTNWNFTAPPAATASVPTLMMMGV